MNGKEKRESDVEDLLIKNSEMEKLAQLSDHFLQLTENDQIDYQKITDDLRIITEAQYAVFNLYGPQGSYFNTVAVSGAGKPVKTAFNILGYDFTKKKWDIDPIRQSSIAGHTITRFSSVAFFAGNLVPQPIADALQVAFQVGEIILVHISANHEMIGDFVLVMKQGNSFDKEAIAEIYSRQVGLVVTRRKAEQALRESNLNFKGIFDKGPIGIAYHRMVYDKKGKPVDYLFLEANQCYQELTGVNPLGLLVTQAFPGIENDPFDWISVFGKVAKNGVEIRFQQFFQTNQRWYDCLCYQYKQDHFVVVFLEITEKKKLESALKESETRYKEIIANISDAVVVCDESGKVKYQSPNMERLFGWNQADMTGQNYLEIIHPDDLQGLRSNLSSVFSGKRHKTNLECRIRVKTGMSVTVDLTAVNLLDNPYIAGVLINLHDISQRTEAENALKQSEEKYRLLTENILDVISVINLSDNRTTYVSPSVYHLRGITVEEALNETIADRMTPESSALVHASIEKHKAEFVEHPDTDRHYITEVQEYRKSGETIWVEWSTRYRYNAQREIELLIVTRDITQRKLVEQERIYLSFYDHLTGLYNRRFFEVELKRLDTERNLPFSIIMGDVNGLKFINDSFGHSEGDELLRKTADILKGFSRQDDIIARLGGDEFAILLPKTNAAETEAIIRRINDLIANEKVSNMNLSISFGFDVKTDKEEDIQEVVKNAEDNMYRIKLYENKSLRSKTIDIVMNALVEKSDRELMHSKRVSSLCERIAVELGYDKDHVNQIRIAGLVHDIGKIGIDERILNKTGKLDSKEWSAIYKHPEAGWRILNSANEFIELSEFILSHHERWDGKGYPRGLSERQIPIEARIIAVADAYDAMTSQRSYRAGISEEIAVKEILRCAGTQFDPMVAQVFVRQVLKMDWQTD
jgi:diguanylate cyclase